MPGLGGNDDAGAAGGDDVAELLQDHGGAVQVDGEDGFGWGLAGGDAGSVDQAGDVGVGLPVGQHDVLAGADTPGDRLADRAWADDDDDLGHAGLLPGAVVARRMVTGWAAGPVTWRRSSESLEPPAVTATPRGSST